MRSYNIPPDASGDGAESDFINRTLKRSGELQFYDSQTVKVEQTTRGVRWHVKIPPPTQGVSAGMVFRGEWDPTKTDYVVQNVVFIRAGSNAGAFVCVKDAPDSTHPPTNPDTGNEYWMAWPGSFPLGQWM